MFELNATLPIFLVMFFIFMALLKSWVLKPVSEVLAERERKLKADIEAGSVARNQAAAVVSDYQSRLQQVRHEAQTLINDTVGKAQTVRQTELKRVNDAGQAKVQEEKQKIQVERTSLVDQLVDEEKVLVATITKKLLGESASVSLDATRIKGALEEAQ